jgi:ABC-type sugar transport system substrate-binding protein
MMTGRTRLAGAAFAAVTAIVALSACSSSSTSDSSTSASAAPSAAASAAGSAAASASAAGSAAADANAGAGKQLGFVAVNLNSPSVTRIKDAFQKSAEAQGYSVEVFDGQGDQNATNNAAMNFIQRGFAAIINDASPNEQMTAVADAAEKAGIPFVSIYGGAPNGAIDAEIGTNEFINSSLITQEMVNKLNGKGRVVQLNWNTLAALADRTAAFDAVMSQNKGVEVVKKIEVKVPGQVDDVYNQLTNLFASDKNIDAVWIGWDELAPPAVRAIQEAGLQDKTFVVGFDGNPFAWDLIRSGSPYIMEPANPFEPMGEKSVETVTKLINGETLPTKTIYMKPCLINAETVPAEGQFPDWDNCAFFPGEIG